MRSRNRTPPGQDRIDPCELLPVPLYPEVKGEESPCRVDDALARRLLEPGAGQRPGGDEHVPRRRHSDPTAGFPGYLFEVREGAGDLTPVQNMTYGVLGTQVGTDYDEPSPVHRP